MIKVETNDPQELLLSIEQAINNDEIITWKKTSSGSFTHATDQWKNKAWFRPTVKKEEGCVIFNIVRPKGGHVSSEAYAIYHSHFSYMLLQHFDRRFSKIHITSLATQGDLV
jgi:hypothetical protein